MQLNVDQLLQVVQPWDFTVVLGGSEFRTRRPTIGQLGAIGALTADSRNTGRLASMVTDLFVPSELGPVPAVQEWDIDQLTAVLSGYIAYFAKWSAGKKADAAATAARAAVEAQALSN
jgi:hypothetical protein